MEVLQDWQSFVLTLFIVGAAAYLLSEWRMRISQKPKKKKRSHGDWLTRNQLEILEQISRTGRQGILLWHTDINVATIRSLAKRGYVETRKGNRIIATRAGKVRLSQPWPADQPTGDQKDRMGTESSNVREIAPGGSGEA